MPATTTCFQNCARDFRKYIKAKEKEKKQKIKHRNSKIGKEETKLILFMVNTNMYVKMQNNYKN